jgi:hypothetical protein
MIGRVLRRRQRREGTTGTQCESNHQAVACARSTYYLLFLGCLIQQTGPTKEEYWTRHRTGPHQPRPADPTHQGCTFQGTSPRRHGLHCNSKQPRKRSDYGELKSVRQGHTLAAYVHVPFGSLSAASAPLSLCKHTSRCVKVKLQWQSFVGEHGEKLSRFHALLFYENLDHDHVLGWARHQARKPPLYEVYVDVRPHRLW